MKILVALSYYTPYISGLTIYAARVAAAWAARGHQVTVLTSQHDKSLPLEEVIDGVRVVRAPVLFKISKGAVMPAFWAKAVSHIKENDVVNIHLPQLEAGWLAWLGRHYHKPTVLTYHCDLQMPPGTVNQLANKAVLWMNDLAGKYCDAVVGTSEDYAENSFFLQKFINKLTVIPVPVELPDVTDAEVEAYRAEENPENHWPIIGMACRFAADKGVEVLLKALPFVLDEFPDACVFFAGPYENVLGEKAYYDRLKPRIDSYIAEGHWKFMGSSRPPEDMTKFYRTIDILVMPSVNRTDSFGLVQIEAMMNGKPVVASCLPGIRVPVYRHGMGKLISVGDSWDLGQSMIALLKDKFDYSYLAETIREYYHPDKIAAEYEELFSGLKKG